MIRPSPKLLLELVPETMWRRNVRAVVSYETWDALRWYLRATVAKPRFAPHLDLPYPDSQELITCNICGAQGENFELHEVWEYDDVRLVQRLRNLIPICQDCHLAMHLGRADQLGFRDKAEAHLASLNNWSKRQTDSHIDEAFTKWHQRSLNTYTLDLELLKQWIGASKIHPDWLEYPKRWTGNRLDAIAWAQGIMAAGAIVLDTETTGLLKYTKVEVIELAALTSKGKVIYHSRFRPRHKITKRTIELHGITNEAVKNAPLWSKEYPQIRDILRGKVVVTYKAEFDRGAIARTCKMYGLELPDCRWDCAMFAYRAFQESGPFLPLPGSTHAALGDCRATLNLLRRMAKG